MNPHTCRLVLFVKDSSEKHKPTLMQILFAIFISIYVDMLVGGLKQAGKLTLCQSELLSDKYLFAHHLQAHPAYCTFHVVFFPYIVQVFVHLWALWPFLTLQCYVFEVCWQEIQSLWLKFIFAAAVFCCRMLLLLGPWSIGLCGRSRETLISIWLVYITTIVNLSKGDKTPCLSITFIVEILF